MSFSEILNFINNVDMRLAPSDFLKIYKSLNGRPGLLYFTAIQAYQLFKAISELKERTNIVYLEKNVMMEESQVFFKAVSGGALSETLTKEQYDFLKSISSRHNLESWFHEHIKIRV